MTAAVGADIEALCTKCGDVWHVVVAKVGERIVRVICKECGSQHRYKSATAQAGKKAPSSSTPRAPRAEKAPVERFEKPAVAADLARPVRPYRASDRFEVGERVEHVQFGQGVVEVSESVQGKITVFFASGRKVLVQAKSTSSNSLERPKPFDHTRPPAGGKPVSGT
jgi:hypothetical protein